MSRKVKTTITLRVTVDVPSGSNAADVMTLIRTSIANHPPTRQNASGDRTPILWEPTVSLLKKETAYG